MYMAREISHDRTYRMTGILPAVAEMTKRLQALGYVKGTIHSPGSFISAGQEISGHEFHYSRLIPDRDARYVLTLSRGKGIDAGKDGLVAANTLGMYTHAYFTPEFTRDLIRAASSFSRS